ncbi:vacuolar protein sorting-associated protein 26B-like [Hyalella azteca]|uniref:Vacuolar protein sorting-associated protein 26 n=1 Tax=Hyalella azteca TaxID=294128 RepID=A0A8B7NVI3_HYAAZ|nr:vacuolar protein sorting-associated protein 26B-like [Hyalella azteca]
MSFFGFGQSAEIEIELDGAESRKLVEIKQEDGRKDRYYLYYDGETVSGKVNLSLKKQGSRLEHQGVKIEFVGQIELYYDRGTQHEFTSLVKELARPGELIHNTSYDFEFNQVEKPYESYTGTNVRLRYFLRVTIVRRISDIVRDMDLIVHTLSSYPDSNNSIKMEVGIEDCLHIEFEYNKSKYHLKDVIVGKIYFLLVRIKIKHMEIAIMKRETTGSGPNTFNENETIAKYEIMDGAPVRGESIPIRVFLAGYDLTPSMRDINKKFSVRYYLNLVLVDEEERRYFKQQEITLWRKGERLRRPLQEQLLAQQQAMQQLHLIGPTASAAAPATSTYERRQSQAGEVPPMGAEPPSPHQSQSPMQEEIPSSSTQSHMPTASPFQQRSQNADSLGENKINSTDAAPPIQSAPMSESAAAAATSVTPIGTSETAPSVPEIGDSASVPVLAAASNETPAPSMMPSASDSANVTSASIEASPVITRSAEAQPTTAVTPLVAPNTPPLVPASPAGPLHSVTPPPIEDGAVNGNLTHSPLETPSMAVTDDDLTVSAQAASSSKTPSSNKSSDIPPLVGFSEPPELPSPPSDPVESPEEEFLEASAASPTASSQKKEPVAAQ